MNTKSTEETKKEPVEKLVKVVALAAIYYKEKDYSPGDVFELNAFYAELWISDGTVAKAEE